MKQTKAKKRTVPDCVVVIVTCPSDAVARGISRQLVQQRLAACVNVVPGVESVFRWQGKVQRAREVLLVAKTTARAFRSVRAAVAKLHPYDVPEIIALPVADGSRGYLRWVAGSVG
jgi:periplasmic divalent cation tolerance protein